MTRRALLMGAQTYGLAGPETDVGAMAAGLARHGFTDIRRHVGAQATRDRMIEAYQRLIAESGPEDVALVYYSGHGSYIRPMPGEAAEVAANDRQFIVPTDYREPFGEDFRGITAVELSHLLDRLTRKTTNVVVVLDCCHSAMMSRSLGAQVPKQLTGTTVLDLTEHLRRRLGGEMPAGAPDELGNRYAVRIAACATEEVAYEQKRWDGSGSYGLLTDAFLRALDETAGVPVSWSRLVERIRRLVHAEAPHQRPEIEGPAERRLFEETPDDSAGSLPAVQIGDQVHLPAAALLGVQRGDRFAIMPGAETRVVADRCLATVEIDRSTPEAASGPIRMTMPGTTLPAGARAFRTRAMAPRIAVQAPARLTDAIAACTFARPAEAGEKAPFRVVDAADGRLVLEDRFGPLHRAGTRPPDLATLVGGIERAARATVLREIRAESGWMSGAPVDVNWGRVLGGKRDPLPLSGAELAVGEPVYIDVHSRAADLYISLVDIGVSYGITLITHRAGSGDHFAGESLYTFGWDRTQQELRGRRLSWPEGLDPLASRPETVLVLVSTRPYDLTSLIQPPVRGATRSTESAGLLSHFLRGTSRDFDAAETEFWVSSVEFTLAPSTREAS